jgi:hypothetical protein
MTRDVAAQAVHERLEHLSAAIPEPDIEAGWAALVAQLEPPIAPVVPLRRPRARRAIVLGVAAAIMLAGGAFAMVRYAGGGDRHAPAPSGVTAPSVAGLRPHLHPPLSGPPAVHHPRTPAHRNGGGHTETGSGGPTSSGGQTGHSPAPDGHHDATHASHHDSPDDTDHGTGNDGTHDDNGQGNDAQGQDTQGNGNGSNSGGGNEQGSGGDQSAGDRGPHGSDGEDTSNGGAGSSSGGHTSQGRGHGGQGSNGH